MTKSVGVIGCGWLGFPLAKSLIKKGYSVSGTTTSENKLELLEEAGISPYRVQLSENDIFGDISAFLKNLEVLILNVPPRLRGKGEKGNYVKKMELLHREITNSPIEKVIFISSTSVYGDISGTITEETEPRPNTESGRQLLQCEKIFQNNAHLETTIIRFGGLIGPGRHPVTMLSRRENLTDGDAPVNLIHLDDCIGIITSILMFDQWEEVFNGVYPYHPAKRDYYRSAALKRNIKIPDYQLFKSIKHKKITTSKDFLLNFYAFQTSIDQ
ncbi:NAD-dependent epimerase/dehydratase family protein [Maribacter sp. 2304DJ31-5]|uniref:NAD-dependent epimerase/dehydratase family protein n=1 Tax=Maribacter sp. 2304DJ31-5 TaxID=3386273 RepID=UPI0039BD381E